MAVPPPLLQLDEEAIALEAMKKMNLELGAEKFHELFSKVHCACGPEPDPTPHKPLAKPPIAKPLRPEVITGLRQAQGTQVTQAD